MRNYILYAALLLAIFVGISGASVVGSSYIHAPAVILQYNKGELTIIKLTVTNGNGTILITGPNVTGNSTLLSAKNAVDAASSYLNMNKSGYDFNYTIENVSNVSGPSAGMAMALLAISAFKHIPLQNNLTVTGTISSNGSVGEIGGIYEKINAAALNGVTYAIVPYAPNGSFEDMLYYITQLTFGVPLVQVSNLTQAFGPASHYNSSYINTHLTKYNPYIFYNLSTLPEAEVNCSNGCNQSRLEALANFTLSMVENQANNVSQNSIFRNISNLMQQNINQSITLKNKGYYYLAADIGFLQDINGVGFLDIKMPRSQAQRVIDNTSALCQGLSSPQMTNKNYEYVIGGNLRALWGNYIISQDMSTYNATNSDTDSVIYALIYAQQAQAWCKSAAFMYNQSSAIGGTPVIDSTTIQKQAYANLLSDMQYGFIANNTKNPVQAYQDGSYECAMPGNECLYMITALQAYLNKSYATSLIDSSYVSAMFNSAYIQSSQNMTAVSINGILSNATFGVWASQFGREAQFYLYQANIANNNSLKTSYLSSAYSSALLAEYMSSDMRSISSSFIAQQNVSSTQTGTLIFAQIDNILFIIFILIILLIVLVIFNIVLSLSILRRIPKNQSKKKIKR